MPRSLAGYWLAICLLPGCGSAATGADLATPPADLAVAVASADMSCPVGAAGSSTCFEGQSCAYPPAFVCDCFGAIWNCNAPQCPSAFAQPQTGDPCQPGEWCVYYEDWDCRCVNGAFHCTSGPPDMAGVDFSTED